VNEYGVGDGVGVAAGVNEYGVNEYGVKAKGVKAYGVKEYTPFQL
jgi:hypothetical protein